MRTKKSILILFSIMVLAFTFAILFSIPLNVTDKAKADTSATTGVGKIYLEESSANAPDARFAVSTYDSWELDTEMSFSVGLDNVSFNSEYLALSLKAEKSTGLVIVRIGVNGSYFNAGQISATNIATAVTSTGNSFNIEQKFGYWFFIPAGFDGTVYIPKDMCTIDGVPLSNMDSFYIQYDSGSNGTSCTINYRSLFGCDDTKETNKVEILDFMSLSSDDKGNVNDSRVTLKQTTAIKASLSGEQGFSGVEIFGDMISAVSFGVKSESEGGKVIESPYEYGWATINLDSGFIPADGLAVNILGVSATTFFKIFIEDENGAIWKTKITNYSLDFADEFMFTENGKGKVLKGAYGCFYLTANTRGTLYLPYENFIAVTAGVDYKGENMPAGETMGKIVKIHIGMDMRYGLGREFAISEFANVSITENFVNSIIDLKLLDDTAVNVENVRDGSVVYCDSTTEHSANWKWRRISGEEEMKEVKYSKLDGLNIKLNPQDAEYTYMYAQGDSSDMTGVDYFSIRIASRNENDTKFGFYFYNGVNGYVTRSGVINGRQAYLFDKSGNYVKSIQPVSVISEMVIPGGFDGYLVIPTTSINWQINKTEARYAVIIAQGTQGISNEQQGTLDTPESKGVDFDFGVMQTMKGTLNTNKTNLMELLNSARTYAELINATRNDISGNVSGATEKFTPVVTSKLAYTYMSVDGIALDASEQAGNVVISKTLAKNAKRVALYVYNESIEPLEIEVLLNETGIESATLLSVIDDFTKLDNLNGKITLPDGFEGYIVFDYNGESIKISLDKGERLGIKSLYAVRTSIESDNASELLKGFATILQTISATDAQIENAFTTTDLTIKRAVSTYYLAPDAPTNAEQDVVFAEISLAENDDNEIYLITDLAPIYKSEELYENTPTIRYADTPSILKNGAKYILFDQGETVTATIKKAGTVYVIASRDFACDGFVKKMAMESFITGIDGRLFLFEKEYEAEETLSVSGAYMIIIQGEESELYFRLLPAKTKFFDEIPTEYLFENAVFWATPSHEITPSGRIYLSMLTGGKTEPVIENVAINYYSDDGGITFKPYFVVDHPYETKGRVFDPQFWYVDGKLWHFFTQADKNFGDGKVAVYAMYTENPDAENIEDVVWSEPFYLLEGVMNSKPIKLANGDYLYNANQPSYKPGEVHVYRSTDKGMTAPKVGVAQPHPNAAHVFTEAKIVELPNGKLWLLKRIDAVDYTDQSFSTDGGVTWTRGEYNQTLLAGGSRFVFTKLPSGNLLYVGNFGTNRNRSNLTAMLSTDNGQTWAYRLELDHRTWVSYPDFSIMPDGRIFVAHDRGRTTQLEIRYSIFTEADIMAGKLVSEGSSLLNIAFKGSRYTEIEKVFSVKGLIYDAEIKKNVLAFATDTTNEDILASLPKDGIAVGLSNGDLKQILGSWSLGSFDNDGYAIATFNPSESLGTYLEDTYKLLQVTVKKGEVLQATGIRITSNPTKLVYKVGESADYTGLVVVQDFNKGDSLTLNANEYAISGFDTSSIGEKVIIVSKDDFTATFTITVESDETPDEPNEPSNPNEPNEPNTPTEKKGCKSNVSMATVGMIGLLGATVLISKRRKNK